MSIENSPPLNGFLARKITSLGGVNPLLHYRDSRHTGIELSKAHPGGIPQFVTGKTVLLSHLIRDEVALRDARAAAAQVVTKGNDLLNLRGIHSIQLAIGLAKWEFKDVQYCAPVMLRPVAMRVYRDDFQMKLMGRPSFNRELALTLAEQYDIELDLQSFAALATESGNFKPQPVIERLRHLTDEVGDFTVFPRLVISCFAHPGREMLDDLRRITGKVGEAVGDVLGSRLVDRIEATDSKITGTEQDNLFSKATNKSSGQSPGEAANHTTGSPVFLALTGQKSFIGDKTKTPIPPNTGNLGSLLLETDEQQRGIISTILEGGSLAIQSVPGAHITPVVINVLAGMIARNKRVLVVSARQSALNDLRNRLRSLGLSGLVVSAPNIRRDLLDAIKRNEDARPLHMVEVNDALIRLRRILVDYHKALHQADEQLGVSPMNALDNLARLSLLAQPPSTSVRFDFNDLKKLSREREKASDLLRKIAELGEFECGPNDSLWYGINFTTNEEAFQAHGLAKELFSIELPMLFDRADSLIAGTKMRGYETLDELGLFLQFFRDSRHALEIFSPKIFDLQLEELIEATLPRRKSADLGPGKRRKLKKLAREYLLPGVKPQAMHDRLVKIQQLRILWNRYSPAGTIPEIPVGVGEVQEIFDRVRKSLASLNEMFPALNFMAEKREELMKILEDLAADSESMKNIKQRADIRDSLHALGMGNLLEDLSTRHVELARVGDELNLAWWQSVLDFFLKNRSALLGGNTSVIERLERDFKLVYRAHLAAASGLLAWNIAESWKVALVDYPDEVAGLKECLKQQSFLPENLFAVAPTLARILSPVWLSSPYSVHQLGFDFDTVIILGAGELSVAEGLGAIARGKQIVAFGDGVVEAPEDFDISDFAGDGNAIIERAAHGISYEVLEESLFAKLLEILPRLEMNNSYRAHGLISAVNSKFYENKINALPGSGNFLGHQSVVFHHVPEGSGLPDRVTGLVEAVDAEVDFVMRLLSEHIESGESCMVVTPSCKMAVRLRQGLRQYDKQLSVAQSAEPPVVVDIKQALSYTRDRVIFSIGYGLTPMGGVMSGFGTLDGDDGERLVTVALTRARKHLDIVGCFQPNKLDMTRLKRGPAALLQVVSSNPWVSGDDFLPAGPMLDDLAGRLEAFGLRVRLNYCSVLPLVAAVGDRAVAVDIDNVFTDLHSGSASELHDVLSLRPQILNNMGWLYIKVHTFELFASPDDVVTRIKRALGA